MNASGDGYKGYSGFSHVAWKDDLRLPKQLLFGWLPNPHPVHGVKLRWRDKVRRDLKTFNIDERTWYALAYG